jgi:hypothetical protein
MNIANSLGILYNLFIQENYCPMHFALHFGHTDWRRIALANKNGCECQPTSYMEFVYCNRTLSDSWSKIGLEKM